MKYKDLQKRLEKLSEEELNQDVIVIIFKNEIIKQNKSDFYFINRMDKMSKVCDDIGSFLEKEQMLLI